MKKILDFILIIIGFGLLMYGGFMLWQRHRPIVVAKEQAIEQSVPVVTDLPSRIEIRSIGVNLPIYPSRITGTKWQTTSQGVSYLNSSPLPGDQGNSVMYGHNWPSILGNLKKIKPGDEIYVFFGDQRLDYLVQYTSVVSSNTTGVYSDTADSRLTLYTCIGLLDQSRLVVVAFPK